MKLTQMTTSIKGEAIDMKWHLIDVKGKILGRIVPEIVKYLQGKNKTNYVDYLDMGDNVVVINAKKVKISGNKDKTKTYSSYSGYPGGLRFETFASLMKKNPGEIIKHAVSGMLPKNKFRSVRLSRLFIFSDENHTFKEQFIKPALPAGRLKSS